VGESGCGKSTTAGADAAAAAQAEVTGSVRFMGQDLLALKERALNGMRGNATSR
jgi:ABC-type glutathione transport system ATPase component